MRQVALDADELVVVLGLLPRFLLGVVDDEGQALEELDVFGVPPVFGRQATGVGDQLPGDVGGGSDNEAGLGIAGGEVTSGGRGTGLEERKTRALAEATGRDPQSIRFFQGLSMVIGRDADEVAAREAEYLRYASVTGYRTHASLGILPDGTRLPDDTRLVDIPNNGGQAHVEWLRAATPGREPTLADLANGRIRRGYAAGTPEQIADQLEQWQAAGVDGINLINWRLPGSYVEFNELLLPVLQRRGLAKTEYAEGTLRHKLFGHDHLPDEHIGARYRGAFSRRGRITLG